MIALRDTSGTVAEWRATYNRAMDSRPIGVFDSGVGGLTVLHECLVTMPHEDFVYLGDHARLPYGPRPLDEVRGYALEIGAYLLAELNGVAQRFSQVGDLRGKGLYIGVELVRDRKSKKPDREAATRVVDMLRDRNVLDGIAGPHGNILKIRPPLCFERDHADLLVKALSDSLATIS